MSADRIVVAEEVVLAADADRRPVAIGFLFGLVYFVLGDVGLVVLRDLPSPSADACRCAIFPVGFVRLSTAGFPNLNPSIPFGLTA